MRSPIYAYKPKSAGKRVRSDTPVEAGAYDLSDAENPTPTGGAADTTPIEQVSKTGPKTNPQNRTTPSSGLRQITPERPIFTLSVAADLLGLHPRTLRIYEEKGLVIPARTDGNRRRYSQVDIEKFQAIRLLTSGGVNLEGVRIILEMAQELTRLGSDPTAIIERNLQTSE
jgi:MerR family transcriptional regulator/heat shock protein HspR